MFMYNILSTMFTSIGESKIPLGLLIFSSILNILMDLWMVAGLGLGVFGAAIATLIAQGISAVFSFLIFFARTHNSETAKNSIGCHLDTHFQKEKDKSEVEKVSEWDTMEEYDNVER